MKISVWALFCAISINLTANLQATDQQDPLASTNRFLRHTIFEWVETSHRNIPLRELTEDMISTTGLLQPLSKIAPHVRNTTYSKMFIKTLEKGWPDCILSFAKTLAPLSDEEVDQLKQALDLNDPTAQITLIKTLPKIKYMWEATKRINPKADLTLCDTFLLAINNLNLLAVGDPELPNNFSLIYGVCKELEMYTSLQIALGRTPDVPEIMLQRRDDIRRQYLEEVAAKEKSWSPPKNSNLTKPCSRMVDYYVTCHCYMRSLIPRSEILMLFKSWTWEPTRAMDQLELLKERNTGLEGQINRHDKMHGWKEAIVNFGKTRLAIDATEEGLLRSKLENIPDPTGPDDTLKERQDVISNMHMAWQCTSMLSAMGRTCPNLYTYFLFMNDLELFSHVCKEMYTNYTLNNILNLWSSRRWWFW